MTVMVTMTVVVLASMIMVVIWVAIEVVSKVATVGRWLCTMTTMLRMEEVAEPTTRKSTLVSNALLFLLHYY